MTRRINTGSKGSSTRRLGDPSRSSRHHNSLLLPVISLFIIAYPPGVSKCDCITCDESWKRLIGWVISQYEYRGIVRYVHWHANCIKDGNTDMHSSRDRAGAVATANHHSHRLDEQIYKERMEMFWLKACPKCQGDLRDIHDVGYKYVSCLQCGSVLTVEQERALPRATIRPLLRATTRNWDFSGAA